MYFGIFLIIMAIVVIVRFTYLSFRYPGNSGLRAGLGPEMEAFMAFIGAPGIAAIGMYVIAHAS